MRPCFFYRDSIDYVVVGLGKLSFRELVNALDNRTSVISIPGIAKTDPGMTLNYVRQTYSFQDSVDASPPPLRSSKGTSEFLCDERCGWQGRLRGLGLWLLPNAALSAPSLQ